MAQVLITDTKLDNLAQAISNKSGVALPLTIDEMATAVAGISTEGIAPTGTIPITQNGTYDVTNYASAQVILPFKHIYFSKDNITPTNGDIYFNIIDEVIQSDSTTSLDVIPSGYLSDYQYSQFSSPSNFYTDASSNTYATVRATSGNSAETYIYFTFDTSALPPIFYAASVSATIKMHQRAYSSSFQQAYFVICLDEKEINETKVTFRYSDSATTITIPTTSIPDWNGSERLSLKFYVQKTNSDGTTYRSIDLYGANLKINYSTTPSYLTSVITEKYNGTDWIPTSFNNTIAINNNFIRE